ncbi:MAG TPA: YihY/virulence factor BrkB family protein [Sphingomonas sp.]|nr:YihY/virulence factor BrkB family protein [Sphingomonas sp.]
MPEGSPESPEARARRGVFARVGLSARAIQILKRVGIGVYSDGFIHAGNLAYLTLLTLFPFFIVIAALAQLFGRSGDGAQAVASFLQVLPPSVGDVLRPAIRSVLAARTGLLLWLGALVGVWTVGSFIETIRDILRRAYGTRSKYGFWHYRLSALFLIVTSVVLMMIAFTVQVALTGIEQFVYRLLPFAQTAAGWIGISRLVPAAVLFGALYSLFYALTPGKYRVTACRKWPGALFTAVWWMAATALLPIVLGLLGGYDLTYGSLAGVIVVLFFFWLVGFGLVIGAHLNAALAESPLPSVKEPAEAD